MSAIAGSLETLLCEAIRSRRLIEFDYDDRHRIVQPYCHGFSAKQRELLRAIQIGGSSRSRGLGFGKLWLVDKMRNIRLTDQAFLPTDPDYNPDDAAIGRIHCRIQSPVGSPTQR
jgi:hypothetical protein